MSKPNPALWATLLATMWRERNPFVLLVQDIKHQFTILVQLRNNMAVSKKRIDKISKQTDQISQLIENGKSSKSGYKLNTFK